MGCVTSKHVVSQTPCFDYSVEVAEHGSVNLGSSLHNSVGFGDLKEAESAEQSRGLAKVKKRSLNSRSSLSMRLGNLNKCAEAEQAAAGWPPWLSAVAGEAIKGWVPLRADSFEKLEKIGQGTYSCVYRARDVKTSKMVALKKVRFDNFQPESVRFMAREIKILRRLDHPNVMKLEGIITSRLSSSIYLVFEYMEHDLAGLISCSDIQFTDAQVKCFMKQLLSGIEHCHSRGVMHRDIKTSNILVNNEGILKVADFGLANVFSSRHTQPLTSRVVTLWYRPPELLLGSTNYGVSVDLWSIGCVFAEFLLRKPMLTGKTEVEQLHKIFKLCGSPPEDFWKKCKLPHATMFKPHCTYESSLRERCKEFPTVAVNLIETFLSIEPSKRGTAFSALKSEYFTTEPYACDPSSFPKYPPNKEIDAKGREDAQRKRAGYRTRESGTSRKPRKVRKALLEFPNDVSKLAAAKEVQGNTQFSQIPKGNGGPPRHGELKSSSDAMSEVSHVTNASEGDIVFTNPLQVPASNGFLWARGQKEDTYTRSYSRSSLRSQASSLFDPSSVLNVKYIMDSEKQQDEKNRLCGVQTNSRAPDLYDVAKPRKYKQRTQYDRPDSFDAFDTYHSHDLSTLYQRDGMVSLRNNVVDKDQEERVELSGPLLSHSHGIDELLQKHETHIRQASHTSLLQRD